MSARSPATSVTESALTALAPIIADKGAINSALKIAHELKTNTGKVTALCGIATVLDKKN